jgi:hypothetical protein
MNLLDYIEKEMIGLAEMVLQDTAVLKKLPDKQSKVYVAMIADLIDGGTKVIRPSPKLCRLLKEVEIRLTVEEYAQPYDTVGVILPGEIFGGGPERFVMSHWKPGSPLMIITTGHTLDDEGYRMFDFFGFGPGTGQTIEEFLTEQDTKEGLNKRVEGHADPTEYHRQLMDALRIVVNLNLFAMDRGIRSVPKPHQARAERRARKARKDPRMAMLQRREIDEVEVQDLHLILSAHAPAGPPVEGSGGWRMKLHRRRGHWRMQPCGKGRTQVKRIYIHSFMINEKDGNVKVDTTLS